VRRPRFAVSRRGREGRGVRAGGPGVVRHFGVPSSLSFL
jgi:hypothetical protein